MWIIALYSNTISKTNEAPVQNIGNITHSKNLGDFSQERYYLYMMLTFVNAEHKTSDHFNYADAIIY